MRLIEGLFGVLLLLPYASGLSVGLSESDYSSSATDGYITASVDRTDTVTSTVTLTVTPMTYAEYRTRYSPLAIPSGCYEARSNQFNNTPVQIRITPTTSSVTISFRIGIYDRNESEPPKSCFVIVLDVLNDGQQTVVIRRNVSALYIYNSHPFTVSFETQEVTVNEDVGNVAIYVVKDNNQKVSYNFTLQLEDRTPTPFNTGDYYSVEQLAIPFPADMQRVPVVVRVTNFNVSMDNRLLRFVISYTEDYALGQPSLVDVNIITNNNVTVALENATYWLMVCLSVVDPILARVIILNIQARNITDGQEFFSTLIVLFPGKMGDCINVDNSDFSSFMVTVTTASNSVLIIPDRDIRANTIGTIHPSSQMTLIHSTLNDNSSATLHVLATTLEQTVTATSLPVTVTATSLMTPAMTSLMTPAMTSLMTSVMTSFTESDAYISPVAMTTMAETAPTATLFIEHTSSKMMQSSSEVLTLATSESTTTAQLQISLTMIATPASSDKDQISRTIPLLIDSIATAQEEHSTNTVKMTTSSASTIKSVAAGTSIVSNLTGTADAILTPLPVVGKDCSWLIILIVCIACGLLCCLCCALAACLYVCLCHRAREKAYFPASVEGHDERYNKWRCGIIDEVKLEEYKMLTTE